MTRRKTTTTVIPIRDACAGFREPTLEEILSDSIVKAVMRADAVDPQELGALLSKVAHLRGDGSRQKTGRPPARSSSATIKASKG